MKLNFFLFYKLQFFEKCKFSNLCETTWETCFLNESLKHFQLRITQKLSTFQNMFVQKCVVKFSQKSEIFHKIFKICEKLRKIFHKINLLLFYKFEFFSGGFSLKNVPTFSG